MAFYDQSEFDIKCEWGIKGVEALAPISDAIVIVDVLSFSTSIDIATDRGAFVFPYQWKNESAIEYARSIGAELADPTRKAGVWSLSPASLTSIPAETKLVLPSPNGSTISLATGKTPTFAGCLRNAQAVAQACLQIGKRISVIAAGERWPDQTLRSAIEDWIAAGVIISFLGGLLSPEAQVAKDAFQASKETLGERLRTCSSGKELIERGFMSDVEFAMQFNVSTNVPILKDGFYTSWRKK
ncbi:MAG: 2-phosphosulfolactate phosphatase [Bdellovibrionaceae bacterium]|nr:2-phosphosulfolactate phosphatase [Pseudobdellovibrionaceae bacterium]